MKNYNKSNKSYFAPNNPSPLSSPVDPQRPKFRICKDREEQNNRCTTDYKYIDDDFDYNNINFKENENSNESNESDDYKSVPPEFFNRLRTFALFKNAPKSFHTKVASNLKLMQFHPQEYIIKKGDPSKSMYWILKGTVSVTSTDGESVYAELASGTYFGEIGILFNRPRTATVIARTKVLLGVLRSDALNVVLSSYPLVERRIRDEAQERLAMQDKKNKYDFPSVINSGINSNFEPINKGIYASQIANASESLPGPTLPPVRHTLSLGSLDNVDATVSIQEFIKSIPIFNRLPSRVIHKMALGADPLMLDPFEYIFRKGDAGSDIYFIVNGEAEVIDYEDEEKKKELSLARLHTGAYFGEMTFLEFLNKNNSYKRSASIRTISSVELIVIKSDILENLCNEFPFIIDHMKRTANERYKSNSSKEYFNTLPLSKKYLLDKNLARPQEYEMYPFPWHLPNSSRTDLHAFSRSVSPTSLIENSYDTEPDYEIFDYELKQNENPLIKTDTKLQKRIKTHHIFEFPRLNPTVPSLDSFQSFQESPTSQFEYIPRKKRIRLANVQRRRSSVLSASSLIPDTILLKVFDYLTLPELMRLRVVCQKWRNLLSTAPNLFEKLDLTKWNTSINDEALKAITNFVGWRPSFIDISNCFHITDESFSYMISEIGISGKINVLKMKSTWEISAMSIMDLTVHSVGQYLEEIDLSNCRKVRDIVVERLIGNSSSQFSDSTENYGCKNLKILNVGYCKHLTDNIMYHICNHANLRLESLDLTRCTTITDKGFEYWANQPFPNLKKLSLKDCTFLTDKSIISIANSAYNLEILDLNFCCALSDISVEVLSLGCPKIRELDLSFCGSAVSDTSLVSISLYLRYLEKLILKGCIRVTRAGLDTLLRGCCPLNFIDVSQCKNAHFYPGRIPAQPLCINPEKKSAFVTEGINKKIVEIVL